MPTYGELLAAEQRVVRLTARMIGAGARGDMDGYYAAARERADEQKNFETLLKAALQGAAR